MSEVLGDGFMVEAVGGDGVGAECWGGDAGVGSLCWRRSRRPGVAVAGVIGWWLVGGGGGYYGEEEECEECSSHVG